MTVYFNDLYKMFEVAKRQFLDAGRDDLASWAGMELSGYPKDIRVPAYRTVVAQARGTVSNDARVIDDFLLPVWHLAGDWVHEDLSSPLHHLVAAIESGDVCFRQPIENDTLALFTRGLRLGNGSRVIAAWWQIEATQLSLLAEGARTQLQRVLAALDEPG